MARGACGCGQRDELFGGLCLECVQKGVGRPSHGDYAKTPHHMKAAERRQLSRTDFALREQRDPPALPLRDPTRRGSARGYILAASGRLRMMKNLGHLKPGEWQEGARHIAEAARRAGIKSHLLEKTA